VTTSAPPKKQHKPLTLAQLRKRELTACARLEFEGQQAAGSTS
jgi:hypothetical protein